MAAMQRLDALWQSTGRRVSLLIAVSEFAEATAKLQGRDLSEVVQGHCAVASMKRKVAGEAVEEFSFAKGCACARTAPLASCSCRKALE